MNVENDEKSTLLDENYCWKEVIDMIKSKVSVIIPIYKVEKYICRCIESVLCQTYNNLEIILVDDGSPDNCPQICEEYAVQDSRIIVIHKKNGGLSSARNAGLLCATGEYVLFVDSDDYIEKNCVEKCVSIARSHDADMVAFSFWLEDENTNERRYPHYKDACFAFSSLQQRVDFLIQKQIKCAALSWNAWGRLFKRQLITNNQLNFPDNKLVFAEDLAFVLRTTIFSKKICVISDVLYHYIQRSDSIMGVNQKVPIEKILYLCQEYEEFLDEHYIILDEHDKALLFVQIILNEVCYYALSISEIIKVLAKSNCLCDSDFIRWIKEVERKPVKTLKIVRKMRFVQIVLVGIAIIFRKYLFWNKSKRV